VSFHQPPLSDRGLGLASHRHRACTKCVVSLKPASRRVSPPVLRGPYGAPRRAQSILSSPACPTLCRAILSWEAPTAHCRAQSIVSHSLRLTPTRVTIIIKKTYHTPLLTSPAGALHTDPEPYTSGIYHTRPGTS